MWSWIPLLGPFIQGAVNAFNHYQDTTVQKARISSDTQIADGAQGVQIIQARSGVAIAFANDVGVKFGRDLILNWYAIYVSLIFYDSCFRNLLPGSWTWRVLALPPSLEYLCAAIVAFLFVTAWRGK